MTHTHPQFRELVLFYRALANERRIALLLFLLQKSANLRTIARHFRISEEAASKHVRMLLRVHLLVSRRWGGEVLFHTAPWWDLKKVLRAQRIFQRKG